MATETLQKYTINEWQIWCPGTLGHQMHTVDIDAEDLLGENWDEHPIFDEELWKFVDFSELENRITVPNGWKLDYLGYGEGKDKNFTFTAHVERKNGCFINPLCPTSDRYKELCVRFNAASLHPESFVEDMMIEEIDIKRENRPSEFMPYYMKNTRSEMYFPRGNRKQNVIWRLKYANHEYGFGVRPDTLLSAVKYRIANRHHNYGYYGGLMKLRHMPKTCYIARPYSETLIQVPESVYTEHARIWSNFPD